MGEKKSNLFRNKYNIMLIIFLVLFFIFMNVNNNQEMLFDEAVRATQGAFFHDYYKTILNDGPTDFNDFFNEYQARYSIGWGVVYPAPAHALLQGIIFLFMGGINAWGAKLATQIFAIIGIIFMYSVATKVFKSRLMGLTSAVFMALSPFNFEYSRIGMHTIAIMSLNLAWFYFMFYHKGKKYTINLSKLKIIIRTSAIWAGIFLAIATLMKYQTVVFAVIFGAVYGLYIIIRQIRKEKISNYEDVLKAIKESGAYTLIWDYIIAGIIFFILGWWWIKFSLIDHGMLEKIKYEGLGRVTWQQNGWQYPLNQLTKFLHIPLEFLALNTFVWLFAIIPFVARYTWKKKDTFLKENSNMIIYVITIYLFFTYIMAHHELRYAVHIFPMVAIFAIKGIKDLSELVLKNKKQSNIIFFTAIIVILGFFIIKDYQKTVYFIDTFGAEVNDVPEYILSKPDPKFIINIKGDGMRTTNYYYSPELYVFKFMANKGEYNPKRINHQYAYTYWTQLEPNDAYLGFVEQLDQTSTQAPVYVFMFEHEPDTKIEKMGSALIEKGFKLKEVPYFKIYEKG